VKAYG